MTRVTTIKREPTPADRAKRAVADQIGVDAFRTFLRSLPHDPSARRRASERFAKLFGAFVADGYGEAALHSALNGAVVAGAPAYRSEKPAVVAAEALFSKGAADVG